MFIIRSQTFRTKQLPQNSDYNFATFPSWKMWKGNVGLCFVSNFFAYLNNKGILIDIPHLLYRILHICCKMSEKMPFF